MRNSKFLFLFSIFYFLFSFSVSGADAATLFLAPSAGSYSTGNTFNVSVKVNTDGKAINTAEATLTFDSARLSIASISKTGSVFSLWVSEPTFSNTDGTITFAGGKPSPGFIGSSGTLVTITFKGLTAGTANVNFSSASVLADDGSGTNILSNLISGAYTIVAKTISTIPPTTPTTLAPTPGGAPVAPVITSTTHPDENQWYSNNDPQFSWGLPTDVTGVSLLLHQKATANPGSQSDGLITSKKFEDAADGVWYFHIKFRNQYGWGATTHRKVLIDTNPPGLFKIIFDNQGDPTNPRPIFNFETTDPLSGVEYYEIIFERKDGTTTTTTATADIKDNPYQPLPLPPEKYRILVKAFDKAKNFASASSDFEILPIESPKITKVPISVSMGEPLVVEGNVSPELTARIYLQKGDGEPILEKIKPDSDGKFKLVYEKTLAKGDYLIWAQAENEKAALSYPTEKHSVEVGLPPFLKIGKIAIDYLTTMITLIILIIGVVAVIFYSWYRITLWRKRMRKETKEVGEGVTRAFRALKEEVEEQIELLDGKPGLNKDERKVRGKLKEALDISEEFIEKEIKDVDKELE